MTGEVTLQGRVLPIGGVRQKVLAAHRAGLTTVVLPVRNGPDLEDVPEAVREEMTFHLASDISEVLDAALDDGSTGAEATTGGVRDERQRRLIVARPESGADEEVGQDAGQLDRLVTLDAVSRALDDHHPVGGSAPAELGFVGVVDHRGELAPGQQDGRMDVLEVVPQRAEVERVHVEPGGLRGPAQLMAPGPGPVLALDGVVQDARGAATTPTGWG